MTCCMIRSDTPETSSLRWCCLTLRNVLDRCPNPNLIFLTDCWLPDNSSYVVTFSPCRFSMQQKIKAPEHHWATAMLYCRQCDSFFLLQMYCWLWKLMFWVIASQNPKTPWLPYSVGRRLYVLCFWFISVQLCAGFSAVSEEFLTISLLRILV